MTPPLEVGWKLDLLALVLGLCVGSFLNVLALRSLEEKSILWPASHCPRCKHPLALIDNIPVLSWLMLRGQCRYCRGPISWQYPLVEAFTGFIFVAIERVFLDLPHSPFNTPYWNNILITYLPNPLNVQHINANVVDGMPWLALGALFLACTLIAVTVTDFREKLIPHDITYPAMIIGIFYSATVRHDVLGAMAGIGASYILFDFIAFYGLKVYLMSHGDLIEARRRRLRRRLAPRRRRRLSRALRWRLDLATIDKQEEEEQIEVMGGGDAVLSAVMSAFLGWQLLSLSLICGFLIGTFMGMFLLLSEMRKANLLHKCARTAAVGALIGATVLGSVGFMMSKLVLQAPDAPMAIPMAILGAAGGCLLGVVSIGTRVSKPYPFGPALAAGGLVATFLLPNWVYLSASVPSLH